MTFSQRIAVAADANVRARIIAAFKNAATMIIGEDTSSMSSGKAGKRHDLGFRVLNNHVDVDALVAAVCTQAAVGDLDGPYDDTNPTDTDITNAITAVWDDLAGVTNAEAS